MTISITKTKKQYAGDGTTTNFIYDFEIEKDEDLKVIVRDSVGNESILVLDDDYTVAGAGNPTGGSITLASGSLCPTGSTLTLMRDTSPVQETDYITGSIFSAESMENALDKLTLLIQEGKEILGRTLVLKRSSAYKDLSLPDPDGGKYLKWNADKTGIENTGSGSTYDADKLDGRDAGNASGNVPISNGIVNTNLNADMVDGKHAQDLLDLASQWANVKDFGAVGDNATDDTAAIQAALNSTFNTIFVPAGIYRISDALTIPYGKILKGTGSPDAPQYSCTSGSWLLSTKGSVIAQTSTSHSAVIMSSKTTLDGINFWYPNQPGITTTPTEYPATIVPSDTHPTKVVINNCVLVNPYVGIDFTVLHELLTIQNVRIFAWFKCIRIDQSYDIDRLIDVHVNPNVMYDGTWTGNTAYVYTINNVCSAFEFGKADQLYVSKCFSYGYTNAIVFSNLSGSPINGIIFDQCGFEFCHIIASMDQIGSGMHILFSGCFLGQLETSIHNAIHMVGTAASPINNVMFSNCVFWRTASQAYFKYVNGLAFYNCFMENLIVESSGTWFEPAISLEYCKDVKIISDTLKVATHGYNEYIKADHCENILLRNLILHDCQNNTQALEITNSTNVGIKDIMCVNTSSANVVDIGNTNIVIGNIWPARLGLAVQYGASDATDDQLIIGRAGSPAAGKPTIALKINNGVAQIGTWNGTTSPQINVEAPLVCGGADGGDKGAGTINAKGVYDDGTLLTCYVLEAEMTGKVDLAKWDGLVLNGKDGKGKKIVRDHKPAKRFSERAADLLDPKKYAEMWRKSGYLPSMPDAEEWKAHGMKMSLGDLVQRLWETVECQSVHIDKLRKRIEELEAKHAKY